MNCLIAGATGLVGSHALRLLIDEPKVHQVVSVTRRSLTSHPKLKQVVVSFDALDSLQLPSCDVALCALGTTIKAAGSEEKFRKVDHDYVMGFARAAKRAGAKKFVLISALGADAHSKFFYNKVKGQTENDLKSLGFESLVILQPSLLLGARAESRPAERIAILLTPLLKPLLIGPLKKYEPVRVSRVAEVMVREVLSTSRGEKVLTNADIIAV